MTATSPRDGRRHLFRQAERQGAADRRRDRLPIFSKAFYADPRFRSRRPWTRRSAPAPTRSGQVNAGRFIVYERVADYWGQATCRSLSASAISTASGSSSTRTRTSSSRPSPRARSPGARSSPRRTGRRATIFPPSVDGRVKRPAFAAERRADMYGWFFNLRRAQFRRSAHPAGDRHGLRLPLDQQEPVLRPLQALDVLLRGFGFRRVRPAEPGRTSAARAFPRRAAGRDLRPAAFHADARRWQRARPQAAARGRRPARRSRMEARRRPAWCNADGQRLTASIPDPVAGLRTRAGARSSPI